jgi:hypothetical protein
LKKPRGVLDSEDFDPAVILKSILEENAAKQAII